MGQKQKVNHKFIVLLAQEHPELSQAQIGERFGLSQCRVSAILRSAGQKRYKRGRPLRKKDDESDLQFDWEKVLHAAGLGMDRGLRINNKRLIYQADPLNHPSEA
jgi:hypothetical protein